jgi:hypothetical protein
MAMASRFSVFGMRRQHVLSAGGLSLVCKRQMEIRLAVGAEEDGLPKLCDRFVDLFRLEPDPAATVNARPALSNRREMVREGGR